MYGIADEYCEEFVNGTALLSGWYNLKDWLDTLMQVGEAFHICLDLPCRQV